MRVLIVDDEEEILELLAEGLSEYKYEVQTAANGQLALERLAKETFDVVVSDVRMPRMDGVELYRRVRAQDNNQTPFLFMTGDDVMAKSLSLPPYAENVMVKPFRIEDLAKAVGEKLAAMNLGKR